MNNPEVYDQSSRLETLNLLSNYLSVPVPEISQKGISIESSEDEYLPTIGAEIEVTWKSVMGEDHNKWFNESYNEFSDSKRSSFDQYSNNLEKELFPKFRDVSRLGVPDGTKSASKIFYEFSHKYSKWYETLASEIKILMDSGMIPQECNLPLHVTLGGIKREKDVNIALSLIELSGGSNHGRILAPEGQPKSWNSKGKHGIKERFSMEMEGKYSGGVEMRTLVANSSEQVRQTLFYSQILGTAIKTKQSGERNNITFAWEEIKEDIIENILAPNDLNKLWQDPSDDDSEWIRFANLFGNPEINLSVEKIGSKIINLEETILKSL